MSKRSRTDRPSASTRGRGAASLVALLLAGVVACPGAQPPPPRAGLYPWESEARIAVPSGWVSLTGGTLTLVRSLLELDTRVGPAAVAGIHDSVAGGWRWSFELELRDGLFTDATGAEYDVSGLADGAVVPGTEWVRLDAGRMKTRGGLVHTFDGSGRLADVHWSSDAYPRLRHVTGLVGAEVRVVAIEQCTDAVTCSPVYTLEWDAQARLAAVNDLAGRRAELAWDAAGRLAAARDAGDVAEGLPGDRYLYDGAVVTSLESSDGEQVQFGYAAGRLSSVMAVGPGSPTQTLRYLRPEQAMNRTEYVDATGATWVYDWDHERRLVLRRQVEVNESTHFEWDGLRVTRVEDAAGVAVERTWLDGWLASETLPGGNVRQYAWSPDGVNRLDPASAAPLTVTDAYGTLLSVVYDAAGRPVEMADGAGDVRRAGWAGAELAWLESAAGPRLELEAYGEHGFPTLIRAAGEIVDEPVYDAVGNRLQGRDLRDPTASSTPGVFERTFDADRRVATLVVADDSGGLTPTEQTIHVHRRADGRPLRIERPYGGDTEHLYDALGRRVERRERVDGAWQGTLFEYDAAGRVVAEEKPNGMRREWAYDPAGRVLTATALSDGTIESVLTSAWQAGRLVSTHDSVRAADELFFYDAAGRVERVVHALGESTELSYDARSRVTELTLRLPDASVLRTLAMAYDGADREVSLRDGGLAGAEFVGRTFAAGRVTETRYGNGLRRAYTFDEESGAWSGAVTTASDGSFVAETTIGFADWSGSLAGGTSTRTADPLGTVPNPPAGSAPGEVRTLESYWLIPGYGPRPHGLRLAMFDAEDPFDIGYTEYDALGNRLKVGEFLPGGASETRDFVYNEEHNRLLEIRRYELQGSQQVPIPYRTYSYDGAGYVSSVDGVPVTWNAQGRVESVGAVAQFTWDAAGRPISRTVMGEETVHWFGGRLEAPVSELPRYLDLKEVRIDLAEDDHRYRHLDFRHNVKFVTDPGGAVVAHHQYGPYRRFATYGPESEERGFAGGTHAAGFVVLGARILDPEAGRFLSPDPIETLLDPYAYTWGNPIHFWDPSGLHSQPAPGAPPKSATVLSIVGFLSIGLGTALIGVGGPFGIGLGASLAMLGGSFLAASAAARDDAARRGASSGGTGSIPPIPRIPAAHFPTRTYCIDGHCFTVPDRTFRPGSAGATGGVPTGGGGGGGGGFDFPSCSAGPGVCALGPVLPILLPWLFRRRSH